MKKLRSAVGYILFSLIALLPVGVIICDLFGYVFNLADYNIFAVLTALAAVAAAIASASVFGKSRSTSTVCAILLSLSSPLSFINTVFYLSKCNSWLVAACMLICMVLCIIIASICGKPFAVKIVALILSFLMFFPTLICSLFLMFPFSENTVVKELPSPDNTYCVQVISSDQGALGGDTIVCVYEEGLDLLIINITKKPEIIYRGDFSESRYMDIYWKKDNCIVINSVEYKIRTTPKGVVLISNYLSDSFSFRYAFCIMYGSLLPPCAVNFPICNNPHLSDLFQTQDI